jgi:outer membrane lipoprotein carrier protein
VLAGAQPAADAARSADAVLAALQERYDRVRTLRARFVQTSTASAFDEPTTSKGTVVVERPGRIRWTYDPPDGRIIVLDGEAIWIYSPEDRQLQIAALAKGGVSPTALSFLMGDGRLRDEFSARLRPGSEAGPAPRVALELAERGEPSFQSLVLWLDPKTQELRESEVIDLFGNRTRLALSDAEYDVKLPPDAFVVGVPEGTERIDLREKPR